MILLGLLFAATESNAFAMLSLSASENLQGTAFGFLGCGVSIALFAEPASVGYIFAVTGSFTLSVFVFVFITGCGCLACVAMMLCKCCKRTKTGGDIDEAGEEEEDELTKGRLREILTGAYEMICTRRNAGERKRDGDAFWYKRMDDDEEEDMEVSIQESRLSQRPS